MINLKQNLLNAWVRGLTFILSTLGFTACDNVFNAPDLYGCPPETYKMVDLKVHGNIVNEQGQNIKSAVTVKVSDDGVNYKPFQTVTTNDYGFYSFEHSFYNECKVVRFVISDIKNYYLPDSVEVPLNYTDNSIGYVIKEFNFTLTPRIDF